MSASLVVLAMVALFAIGCTCTGSAPPVADDAPRSRSPLAPPSASSVAATRPSAPRAHSDPALMMIDVFGIAWQIPDDVCLMPNIVVERSRRHQLLGRTRFFDLPPCHGLLDKSVHDLESKPRILCVVPASNPKLGPGDCVRHASRMSWVSGPNVPRVLLGTIALARVHDRVFAAIEEWRKENDAAPCARGGRLSKCGDLY